MNRVTASIGFAAMPIPAYGANKNHPTKDVNAATYAGNETSKVHDFVMASKLPESHASPLKEGELVPPEKSVGEYVLLPSGYGLARIHKCTPCNVSNCESNIIPLFTDVIEKSAYPV
jgi:hypothetical protein